jgi:hypothetical protein
MKMITYIQYPNGMVKVFLYRIELVAQILYFQDTSHFEFVR